MECPNCNSIEFYVVCKPIEGGEQFRKQCFACGFTTAQSIKRSEVKEFKEYNAELYNEFNKKEWDLQRSTYKEIRIKTRQEWHDENDRYYLSVTWNRKRIYVLNRDNHLCQMCLTNSANDVHHTSYLHFGNELTSELISVCRDCHNMIHNDKEPF
jgi:5-methylcytosine-specific restriction protein A